jgi:protoheme IX farnesyltransferase
VGVLALGTLLVALDVDSGCTGWPLCNGGTFPPNDQAGVLSFVHRMSAAGLALLIGALTLVSYLRLRHVTWLVRLTAALFIVVLAQAVVGGFGVAVDFPSWTAALHLTLALMLIAGLAALVIYVQPAPNPAQIALPRDILLVAIVGAFGALLAGAVNDPLDTAQSCGSLGSCLNTVELGQSAGVAGAALSLLLAGLGGSAVVAWRALRDPRRAGTTRALTLLATALLASALGAPLVFSALGFTDGTRAVTSLLLTAGWLVLIVLVLPLAREPVLGLLGAPHVTVQRSEVFSVVRDYARVTKPGIMLLLLTTTLGGMLVAAEGWPGTTLVALTLFGGALASGGASALNCYFDRDVDQLMARTRKRPIPTGGLSALQVRGFALLLSVAAVVVLATWANPLAAVLAVGGHLFYITIYTLWLKRRTPQNIVIGGAAGSFPPLVGWAAVTGTLSLPALLIAAIIFYWTPPHFWSLALLKANDYRRAGIPMLPVTHGEAVTRRSIFLYALLLLAVTALLGPAGGAGWLYLAAALLLGGYFVALAARMWVEGTSRLAWRLFKYSNYYLAALLAVLVIDRVLSL